MIESLSPGIFLDVRYDRGRHERVACLAAAGHINVDQHIACSRVGKPANRPDLQLLYTFERPTPF